MEIVKHKPCFPITLDDPQHVTDFADGESIGEIELGQAFPGERRFSLFHGITVDSMRRALRPWP